jgi:hypothetical protein
MKRLIIAILVMVLSHITFAQNSNDCTSVLNKLINKVEKEYPGFHIKTKDFATYTSFKNNLINSSLTAKKDSCFKILKAYLNFFKDGHLVIYEVNVLKNDTNPTKSVKVDIENFNKYVENSRDSLEGIWKSGGYRVGVMKNKNGYDAFVITAQNTSWKPLEIKFTLDGNRNAVYFMGDHSQTNDTFTVHKNHIIYFKNSKAAFVKELPKPLLSTESISEELNLLEGLYIKELSDKTILLRITSFDPSYTKRIEKLIEDKKELLNNHINLIIDVRGNGGGSDFSFRPILPYLYSNPVRFLGGEYLVTQTLIDGLKNWADNEADKVRDTSDIKYVRNALKRMEGKIGQFIPYSEGNFYGFTKRDSVYKYPQNIAIVIDKHCGSTTENFIFNARQSKKVKLFGTPTFGGIDYVSMRRFDFGSKDYILNMPTVRAMRLIDYPLDNIGIQPDIYMDKYIGDWIQYAKEYLEN